MEKNIEKFNSKWTQLLFLGFVTVNVIYFYNNFLSYFYNKGANADESYWHTLYDLKTVSVDQISSAQSQPFIFVSSIVNFFLNDPKMATRWISLVLAFGLLYFLFKKFKFGNINFLEKIIISTFMFCTLFITSQMYNGTPDFLSVVLMVPILMFIIKYQNIQLQKVHIYPIIFIGFISGLAVSTRPTVIVIFLAFVLSLLLVYKKHFFTNKTKFIIGLIAIGVFALINFKPIINQHTVVLDVKEIPKEMGTSWFEMNYLMAKKRDQNEIPNSKWLSAQDVIEYKRANPKAFIPKNQFDLLVNCPGLYFRQMMRMFIKAMYTNFRFNYFLFPLLLSVFFLENKKIRKKINKFLESEIEDTEILKFKTLILTHILSILIFSFLAVKMFEARWVIATLIIFAFYALEYLLKFKKNFRFFVYNCCFITGIILYLVTFYKEM